MILQNYGLFKGKNYVYKGIIKTNNLNNFEMDF